VPSSGEYSAQTYTNLSNGQIVASCLRNGEPQSSVIASTFQFPQYSKRRAELIKNVSSYKYGRTREKIEKTINRELGVAQLQQTITESNQAKAEHKSQNTKIRQMVKQLAKAKKIA
jgi:hypothetical protein